jgi:hypothetical protein
MAILGSVPKGSLTDTGRRPNKTIRYPPSPSSPGSGARQATLLET